jgi:hypothetical protein
MPILLMLAVVEILCYGFWISILGLGTFVYLFLFQTFLGFLLLSSTKSMYYKSIAVFHILPVLTLRMLGLFLLLPLHLLIGEHLKRKMRSRFQSGVQNQKHFQFIFKQYGAPGSDRFSNQFEEIRPFGRNSSQNFGTEMDHFNGENFDHLKDVTPTEPKFLQPNDQSSRK